MKNRLLAWVVCLFPMGFLSGQISLELNGALDLMLSRAGDDSEFYYNGVHRDYTDWRAGISEVNLLSKLRLGDHWAVNNRLILARRKGGPLDLVLPGALNLEWKPGDGRLRLQVGRFLTPFGLFSEQPLSTDRTFIALPLTHQYATTISAARGGLYPLSALTPGKDRGLPMIYYWGYQTGLRSDWQIVPDRLFLALALTTGAPMVNRQWTDPLRMGATARLRWQPAFFWQQSVSAAYGQFLDPTEENAGLPRQGQYHQFLLGTDATISYSFWEFSGELIAGWYRIPFFDLQAGDFLRDSQGGPLNGSLFNLGGYLTLKFEPPFLSGAYLAYRFGWLTFGDSPLPSARETWDAGVNRHSFAMGYKITRWLLLRSAVTDQQPQWRKGDYWTWQTMLTLHF